MRMQGPKHVATRCGLFLLVTEKASLYLMEEKTIVIGTI
jgi:hypothetical protein